MVPGLRGFRYPAEGGTGRLYALRIGRGGHGHDGAPGGCARDDRPKPDLRTPRDPREAALERLRRHVEENSDYVGMSFAAEARAMHEGLAPERAIHGEAKPEEARKLIEDGIPVAPLPFRTRERAN